MENEEVLRAVERLTPERAKVAMVVLECLPYLGPNALELLADQAQGLRLGALQYGDWDDAERDIAAMAREEARDGATYAAWKRVQLKRQLREWGELGETFERAHAKARGLEKAG